MNNKKTGVSMGGSIECTRSENTKNFIRKIDSEKKKRSKVCIKCDSNNDGYCTKHKGWCGKVNYICLGIENPYAQSTGVKKVSSTKQSAKKKVKDILKKCNDCSHSNGNGHCTKFKKSVKTSISICKLKHYDEDIFRPHKHCKRK